MVKTRGEELGGLEQIYLAFGLSVSFMYKRSMSHRFTRNLEQRVKKGTVLFWNLLPQLCIFSWFLYTHIYKYIFICILLIIRQIFIHFSNQNLQNKFLYNSFLYYLYAEIYFCFYLFEPVVNYFYKFVYINIYYWRQTGVGVYISYSWRH